MASENYTEFNLPANAYTTFDAVSIKELLTSKLIDDGVYTDQVFEGSNMSSLIDVLSYTYHLLLFYLNNTASESMFSETEIYENINRIVKVLNYSPNGGLTGSVGFTSSATGLQANKSYTIPRYTYLSIGTTKYSFPQDVEFSGSSPETIGQDTLLYEGIFKSVQFTAIGEDYEIITIQQPENGFIDFNNVNVYMSRESTTGVLEFSSTASLFLHSPVEAVFEKRLNEAGDIEIKFGNGITGLSLEEGDTLSVFYLHSTGTAGEIGPNALGGAAKTIHATPLSNYILNNLGKNYIEQTNLNKISFNNDSKSISPSERESVSEIKTNAIQAFKSQSKLTTSKDYEVYIKSRFGEIISDVYVTNNNGFVNEYLEYIDTILANNPGFESRLLYNHSQFSSTSTFNNIYAFVKPRVESKTSNNISISFLTAAQKQAIQSSVDVFKSVTTDITLVDPVYIALDFGIQLPGETLSTDLIGKTQLVITKDPLSLKNIKGLKNSVFKVFTDAFDVVSTGLGTSVNIVSLFEGIFSIEGVKSLRMVRSDENFSFNGISFLAWNPVYPETDINVLRQNTQFENFKAPYIYDTDSLYNNIIIE